MRDALMTGKERIIHGDRLHVTVVIGMMVAIGAKHHRFPDVKTKHIVRDLVIAHTGSSSHQDVEETVFGRPMKIDGRAKCIKLCR